MRAARSATTLVHATVVSLLLVCMSAALSQNPGEELRRPTRRRSPSPEHEGYAAVPMEAPEPDAQRDTGTDRAVLPSLPITNGFVILEGHYVSSPYTLEWRDNVLCVNDVPVSPIGDSPLLRRVYNGGTNGRARGRSKCPSRHPVSAFRSRHPRHETPYRRIGE